MMSDQHFKVQHSPLAAFVSASKKGWMDDELSHRPLLRLPTKSEKKMHCLTILADNSAIGFACLTEGDQIILSPMSGPATTALAEYFIEQRLDIPGIFAPKQAGTMMARALERLNGAPYSAVKHILHWALLPPINQSHKVGQLRRARPNDISVLIEMFMAMQDEMNTQRPFNARQMVTAALKAKSLYVGDAEQGEIACVGTVDLSDRESQYGEIGHIYTAPPYRGHGFASALIGHLAKEIVKKKSAVFLSSDANDAASRRLYHKMGFIIGAEMVNLRQQQTSSTPRT